MKLSEACKNIGTGQIPYKSLSAAVEAVEADLKGFKGGYKKAECRQALLSLRILIRYLESIVEF